LQHPFSRGYVHINTTNPTASPVIDPRYLSNTFDLSTLAKATGFIRKIVQTEPLTSAIAEYLAPPLSPGTDSNLEGFVRKQLAPGLHLIGTASMAPEAWGGVVNPRLQVYGTANVRVADASVMPLLIATHMQQTVYTIGEKAAAIIMQDHSQDLFQ